MYCDGCNLGLHQHCANVPEVPEGEAPYWCDYCLVANAFPCLADEPPPVCLLCGGRGGGLIRAMVDKEEDEDQDSHEEPPPSPPLASGTSLLGTMPPRPTATAWVCKRNQPVFVSRG